MNIKLDKAEIELARKTVNQYVNLLLELREMGFIYPNTIASADQLLGALNYETWVKQQLKQAEQDLQK